MGTWGTAIKSNDTSSDIYSDFFDLYNKGQNPVEISEKLIKDNKEIIKNPDDCNNFWFVIALAQWETKCLDKNLYEKVKSIIKSGQDLEVWRELDADETEIKKRKIALDKFLEKISSVKLKAKPRKKKKFEEPVFEKGTCLTFKLNNGNYGGAVILAADNSTGCGYNLIASTRLNQSKRPTKKDFEKTKVLVTSFGNWKNEPKITWYLPDRFKKDYSDLFEIIDKIEVDIDYNINEDKINTSFSAGWHNIIESVNRQFEYEKAKGKTKSFPLTELTKQKKWWKFW